MERRKTFTIFCFALFCIVAAASVCICLPIYGFLGNGENNPTANVLYNFKDKFLNVYVLSEDYESIHNTLLEKNSAESLEIYYGDVVIENDVEKGQIVHCTYYFLIDETNLLNCGYSGTARYAPGNDGPTDKLVCSGILRALSDKYDLGYSSDYDVITGPFPPKTDDDHTIF